VDGRRRPVAGNGIPERRVIDLEARKRADCPDSNDPQYTFNYNGQALQTTKCPRALSSALGAARRADELSKPGMPGQGLA
jgi:hypothetical protein